MARAPSAKLFAILAACAGMAHAAPGPSALTTASGIVSDGQLGPQWLWFTLSGSDLRFEAPVDRLRDPNALFAIAKDSAARAVTITVRYDLDSGYIDPATGAATFDLRAVNLGDKSVVGVAGSADVRRTAASPAEAALAQALGLADNGDPNDIHARLTAVLADAELPVPWRIKALKMRASSDEDSAIGDYPAGPERDRRLLSALADNRAWAGLAPDDADAPIKAAVVLRELGAYEEALAAFRAARAKWPGQDYLASVGIGATYRIMGQNDRALAELDDLVRRSGPPSGMRYFFHRGRILLALGRNQDAVAAFDAGLKDQPDYAWAMAFRACALAGSGQVKAALDDERRALAGLSAASAVGRKAQGVAADMQILSEATARLQRESAVRPTSKLNDLCDGFWDDGQTPRERSPLLPKF